MGKFTKDATELLKLVGGKENIQAASHCVTRMRFVLVDPSKADVNKIEDLPSTKGTFTQSGQFQVNIPWWRSHPIHENRATKSIWTEPCNPLLRATKSTKRATSA